jgi:hypothetical protein
MVFHNSELAYCCMDHFCKVARRAVLGALTVAVRVSRSPSVTSFAEDDRTGLAAARSNTDAADVIAFTGATVIDIGNVRPTNIPVTNPARARFNFFPCLTRDDVL